MAPRSVFYFRAWLACICFSGLLSCSKKDLPNTDSGNGILSFSLLPGKDISKVDAVKHLISVRVPDTLSSGNQLPAYFNVSSGTDISVDGIKQQSGITLNNFEKDLEYTLTNGDQQSKKIWTVQATNNTYSRAYGLGHFINRSKHEDRTYNWYIDQSTSGNFSAINCGPASVTMAVKWADAEFTGTALDARKTYEISGGWWYTNDVEAYLSKYNISHAIIALADQSDSTRNILMRQLNNHQILILCLDMNFVRSTAEDSVRVDKFYPTTPGWGHFIVLKGYQQVDGELYFECYDPYSFGLVNDDQTLKGLNRYYRYEDLAAACRPWWNYTFVIAKKGSTLGLDARNRKLNPAHVPVAHSSNLIF